MPLYLIYQGNDQDPRDLAETYNLKEAKALCRLAAAESPTQYAVVIDARTGKVVFEHSTGRKPTE